MASLTSTLKSPAELQAWGRRLAKLLKPGDIVALVGDLGAGKTMLVQSIAKAWGYKRGASSPTFALANEYETPRGTIYHMDMYRLTPPELATFPLEEYLNQGLCLIEWADRVQDRLPKTCWKIRFSIPAPDRRVLRLSKPSKSRARI